MFMGNLKLTISVFLLSASAFVMPASATPLPDISPDQIRLDTERRYNPETGASELIAPSFDPFELDDSLAGSASLRSAGQAVSIDGQPISGGAFLDVSLFYTTGSNDPYDTRGTDRGIYLSGQPIDTVRYDSQILDCSENVREVVYDDGYYSGARYGYLAGIYRLFPRYRGHRNFGHHRGYGYRSGYTGRHRSGDRTRRMRDNDGFRDGRRGHTGRADRNRDRDRDRTRGERNNTPRVSAENGSLVTIPQSRATNGNRDRARRDLSVKERRHQENRRNTRHNRKDPKQYQNNSNGGKEAAQGPKTPRLQIAPPRRTVKTPVPTRTRPVPARTEKAPKTYKAPRQERARPTRTRKERSNVSRSVDRHFGGTQKNRSQGLTKHKLNFYPMQFRSTLRSDVSVSYRCAREEMLTLHIPQDRLDAARFEGFTVLLLDRQGREIPVYVPPNYVEGFRQATGRVSYSAPPPARGYPQPGTAQPVQGRDPNSPIIYGETGL